MKNTAVPIRLCFVDTGSSFGTGMNENISTAFKSLIGRGARYSWMKDSFKRDLRLALFGLRSSVIFIK